MFGKDPKDPAALAEAVKRASSSNAPGMPASIPESVSDLHCFTETGGVITTTMFDVPGYRVVKVLGAVYGLTVRTRNWAAGLGMVAKSIVGGELSWFTTMVSFIQLHSKPPLSGIQYL